MVWLGSGLQKRLQYEVIVTAGRRIPHGICRWKNGYFCFTAGICQCYRVGYDMFPQHRFLLVDSGALYLATKICRSGTSTPPPQHPKTTPLQPLAPSWNPPLGKHRSVITSPAAQQQVSVEVPPPPPPPTGHRLWHYIKGSPSSLRPNLFFPRHLPSVSSVLFLSHSSTRSSTFSTIPK